MKIELHEIPIREVAEGYSESEEGGVVGYSGRLNIRPAFQREFIYKEKQRDEVIRSVRRNFPLNVMYWMKNDDGTFEMLDGQQRTISVCRYLSGGFSVALSDYVILGFENLTADEKEQIRNYRLMIYFCEGTEREKLDWFEIVNIAGEKLMKQEMRNAVFSGAWLTDAKRYFCKSNCAALKEADANKYLKGDPLRQDYLETVLRWITDAEGYQGKPDDRIEQYMADHQHDPHCGDMWIYFRNVIDWVKILFPEYRKEMNGIEWGLYYNRCRDKKFDPVQLEARIQELLNDDDVTSVSGIYEYLLDGQEKHLSLRKFRQKDARAAYERQQGKCEHCGEHFEFEEMQADHIIAWCDGGHTTPDNCQMLCRRCNAAKGKN